MDDLAEKMQAGDLNYDVVIATPDAMRVVGKLGQVLGPRGLMPNPKVGPSRRTRPTAVKNAKAGQVRYRTDKAGIIHCTIGKANLRSRCAEGQPQRAAGRPDQGQAGDGEGRVPAEDLAELDTMGLGVIVSTSRADASEVIVSTGFGRRQAPSGDERFEGARAEGGSAVKDRRRVERCGTAGKDARTREDSP